MEQSVDVEENHRHRNNLPSSRDSSSSYIRIDPISVDLAGVMDNHQDAGQCNHDNFSIREYVAGMRQRDIGVCLPFPSAILPDLHVVDFKLWSCHNCLRQIGDAWHAQDIGNIPESLLGGTLSEGTRADGSDAVGRSRSKNVEIGGPSFRGPISSNIRQLENNNSSFTEIVQTETSKFPNGQQRMEIENSETISNVNIGDINITKGKTSISRSLDDSLSESSNGFPKNDYHDGFEGSSRKSAYQRAPKVRLMAELLPSVENAENNQSRSMDSVPEESSGTFIRKKNLRDHGTSKRKHKDTPYYEVGDAILMPPPKVATKYARKDSDANGRKGVDFSVDSHKIARRNKESCISKDDIFHRGEPHVVRNSATDVGSEKDFDLNDDMQNASPQFDLNCDRGEPHIATESPMDDMQNASPQFGTGSIQLHQEMNMSVICTNEPKSDDQDKGNDEFPMEIVELMAKNLYDRRQDEFEKYQNNDNRKFESIGLTKVHGNGLLKSFQVEDHTVRKPIAQTTCDHLAHMKTRPTNFFSGIDEIGLNTSKMGGKKSAFERRGPLQGTQSAGVSSPGPDLIRIDKYPNFQWKSDNIGSSFCPPEVGCIQNPNYTNFPQPYAPQANKYRTNFQIPEGSASRGNIATGLDLDSMNNKDKKLKKQHRNLGLEPFRKSSSVDPISPRQKDFDLNMNADSLDLQTNESIPAMLLLNLVNSARESNPFFHSNRNSMVIHKPSSPSDHPSFGRDIGVSNNGSSFPSPSSLYGQKQWADNLFEGPPSIAAFEPLPSPLQMECIVEGGNETPPRVPSEEKRIHLAENSHCKLQNDVCIIDVEQNMESSNSIHSNQQGSQDMKETVFGGSDNKLNCVVNRNPADFSTPGPRNIYMVSGRALKRKVPVPRDTRKQRSI